MNEPYFLEEKRNGEIELYETDGAFYNHGSQDLLIATFYEREQANKVCKLLNDSRQIKESEQEHEEEDQ